ncbi:MAG: hypothetical protein WDN25_09290 [Acetobacteraceae bacterium]
MSDSALLLGPIAFRDFEVPAAINFGGRQRLALHRLPGGTRIIDALGRDDAQITFSGIFTGSDATLRARTLDELRVAAIALPLTWDVFFYTVMISEFHADYRGGSWIPYRIVCTVLQDEASALLQTVASLATAVLADIGMAAGYALEAGLQLSPLRSALGAPGATIRGTGAFAVAQGCLGDTQASLGTSIASEEATLAGVDIPNAGSPQAGVAGLLTATGATGRLSSFTTANSYVRRAAINLGSAST